VLLEVGQPDRDERGDLLLEAGVACERERPLPALPGASRVGPLLQAIVALNKGLLDTNTGVIVHFPHLTR
jgi:hypothetical protein